jgi:hypothetical protein
MFDPSTQLQDLMDFDLVAGVFVNWNQLRLIRKPISIQIMVNMV